MRATHEEQRWVSSEKMTITAAGESTSSNARSSMDKGTPKRQGAAANTKNQNQEQAISVRIRDTAPPDPELLSKIGCRCLVIDLPGVQQEDMKISYRDGFVRVEGKRTVGRVKAFRKKFPLNHEQVVTRMLSAFLSQGVLVIVAPTKVAASMAAAAMVAAQIASKGYKFPTKPKPQKKMLLLTQDPAEMELEPEEEEEEEEPVKFSKDVQVTKEVEDTAAPKPKSAFGPYVSPASSPPVLNVSPASSPPLPPVLNVPNEMKYSDDEMDVTDPIRQPAASRPKRFFFTTCLPRKKPLQKFPSDESSGNLHRQPSDERRALAGREQPEPRTEEPKELSGCVSSDALMGEHLEAPHDEEKKVEDIMDDDDHNANDDKLPHLWSDDSLWDEPSDMRPKNEPRRRSIEDYDVILGDRMTMLSPIKEHQEQSSTEQISPSTSTSQSSPPLTNRPLTWVKFENVWQNNEEHLIIRNQNKEINIDMSNDTEENENDRYRRRMQHGIHENPDGVQEIRGPMIPYEDELVDRIDDHGLRMELEPHPYWRSAPFLPGHHQLETIDSVASRGLSFGYRGNAHFQEQQAPTPSLLRRQRLSGRKFVTWADEI